MIVLKDIDKVLSDYKVNRHMLINDFDNTELILQLDIKNDIDLYNQHYHLFSIANLHPPFILNTSLNEEDYYPVFWFAEYFKDGLSDVLIPSNNVPDFYNIDNTFFLTVRRRRDHERVEEYFKHTMATQNVIRCEIFYQEKNKKEEGQSV